MTKHIAVIGGRTGIGSALVDQLSVAGHYVIATSSKEWSVDLPQVQTVTLDVTAEAINTSLFPDVLDGLVYCPGTITLKPFQQLKLKEFQHDLSINFFGAVRLLQSLFPRIKASHAHPSVVLFSTVAVQQGMPYHASIASAKGAIEGLARSLAAEWAPHIRVNAIAPSLTKTPLSSSLTGDEAKEKRSMQYHPLKQLGHPEDLAAMAGFLLSDQARFMTGQVIGMDGGLSSIKTFH